MIEAVPKPNWRETFPIWELQRYDDSSGHVAWKLGDGLAHAITYTIDDENLETIIRASGVAAYILRVPNEGDYVI